MNHNATPPPKLTATVAALDLIAELSVKHPELPAPYLVFSTHDWSVSIGVQCQTLDGFEAWREALGINPDDVTLFVSMLSADLAPRLVGGREMRINLYVGGLPGDVVQRMAGDAAQELLDEGPMNCISIPDDWRARCLVEGVEPPAFPRQPDGGCDR